jgi:hypothetical protein
MAMLLERARMFTGAFTHSIKESISTIDILNKGDKI